MADEDAVGPEPTQLLGRWRLERRTLDRLSGQHGRMSGTLELREHSAGVRWYESGTFRVAGQAFAATRELLVRRDEDGWTVCFADGRPFHPWRPGSVVVHPCRADVYRGLVRASSDRLRVLWDVSGPAKDQRLITRCRRA